MPTFSWEEIQKHNLRTDKWLVIDRKVYNITEWSHRHPGGQRVIGHYAGEDATRCERGSIYRARRDPCVRPSRGVRPEPETPRGGRSGLTALAPPMWKMAAPAGRGKERERRQPGVGLGACLPLSIQTSWDSLLLGLLSKKARNGRLGKTAR
ncbi:hypothetical protein P7K49_021703 [Saguinus oedipus]|uniref:Acyl-CoA 6-desaturase n=1 Tax=Saguinus oedipus TaxID=9490 RepID=A0ABQ9UTF0_SAGOE|nr:hypothetical protein P7K49_021703 [Saguinus oedipus]